MIFGSQSNPNQSESIYSLIQIVNRKKALKEIERNEIFIDSMKIITPIYLKIESLLLNIDPKRWFVNVLDSCYCFDCLLSCLLQKNWEYKKFHFSGELDVYWVDLEWFFAWKTFDENDNELRLVNIYGHSKCFLLQMMWT